MKSPLLKLAVMAAVFAGASLSTLRADDWKTNDGKVYQDVKVIRAEPDAVTILHRDGGGRISLADLPGDLQKRFNYDPVKAKAAADERARDDAENGKALQAEMNEASDMRQPGAETADAPADDSSPTQPGDVAANTTAPRDANHHSMDELSSLLHTLKPDSAATTHHSIDDLTSTTSAMRPDLSDPTNHTMAHFAYTIHSLAADPDPNHHTIDELSDLRIDPDAP